MRSSIPEIKHCLKQINKELCESRAFLIGVISYELKPYNFDRDLGDLLERYKDGLSPEKWCTVKIHDFNNKSKIIWNMQKELSDRNITFDAGSDFKTRDWELDWSFKVGE